MKAVRYHAFGGPEVLRFDEVEKPVPGPGEVLVRVEAAAVNPIDAKIIAGQFPSAKRPRIPGIDFAGVVEQGGAFPVGTKVFGSLPGAGIERDGAFAEWMLVPADGLVKRPARLASVTAAALGVVYLTASMVIEAAAVSDGRTVLVHGAGGGVGQAVIQLAARAHGAHVIAVASGEDGVANARALGAREVLDRTKVDVFDEIPKLTEGRGVDTVVDVVGGSVFERSLSVLAPYGTLVSVGVSAGATRRVSFDLPAFYRSNLRIAGVTSSHLAPAERARMLGDIAQRIARDELAVPAVDVMPMADVRHALERVLSPEGAHGKIVLAVGLGS